MSVIEFVQLGVLRLITILNLGLLMMSRKAVSVWKHVAREDEAPEQSELESRCFRTAHCSPFTQAHRRIFLGNCNEACC